MVKAGIAHCPEERKVWPHMTVQENLELGAFLQTDRNRIKQKLEETYADFPVLSRPAISERRSFSRCWPSAAR